MIKMKQLILAGAVALSLSDAGLAQYTPSQPPGGATPHFSALVNQALGPDALPEPLPIQPNPGGIGGGVLQALPKPVDLPGSLFAPPPPPSTGYLRVDAPYLVPDPLLDFPPSSPPGWFSGVEIQIVKTHVIPGLSNVVTPGQRISNSPTSGPATGNQQLVSLPSAALNWTVSPKVFVGYRLPSGFGEFMASYRYLGTGGSGTIPGSSGPLALSSRAALNIIDFDYNSRELSLGPNWDMKWTIGLRNLTTFYDSRATQSSAQAAAGNGILQQRNFNNLYGIGPHVALGLSRHLGNSRWSLSTWGDFGATFDYTNQEFYTRSLTPGSNSHTQFGQTNAFGHQASPMINGRVGLTWQPSPTSDSRFFIGYQYEYFWDLVRVSQGTGSPFATPSLGQIFDQGIVLQATFRY